MPLEVLLVEDSPGDVRLTSATLVRTSSCTWLPMALPPWPFSDARAATAKRHPCRGIRLADRSWKESSCLLSNK